MIWSQNYFRQKKASPRRYSGSRDGFQKLNDSESIYSDSEEENIEFDKYAFINNI